MLQPLTAAEIFVGRWRALYWATLVSVGCLTLHLPHEIMWNANLMQQGNFIDIFLARHVLGMCAHHQEH